MSARRRIRRGARLAIACAAFALPAAPTQAAADPRCAGNRSREAATWLSVAHPGLGEWYLKDWGGFWGNAPQKKFWLGFIPIFGWPGYLQVKSAIDAFHCRTNDNIGFD